jgi:hypothetical protein
MKPSDRKNVTLSLGIRYEFFIPEYIRVLNNKPTNIRKILEFLLGYSQAQTEKCSCGSRKLLVKFSEFLENSQEILRKFSEFLENSLKILRKFLEFLENSQKILRIPLKFLENSQKILRIPVKFSENSQNSRKILRIFSKKSQKIPKRKLKKCSCDARSEGNMAM